MPRLFGIADGEEEEDDGEIDYFMESFLQQNKKLKIVAPPDERTVKWVEEESNYVTLAKNNELNSLTMSELYDICRVNGWSSKRNKADYIRRIRISLGLQDMSPMNVQSIVVKDIQGVERTLTYSQTAEVFSQACRELNLPVTGSKGTLWERLVLYSQDKWVPLPKTRTRRPKGSLQTLDPMKALENELNGSVVMIQYQYNEEDLTKENLKNLRHFLLPKRVGQRIKAGKEKLVKFGRDWPYGDTSRYTQIWYQLCDIMKQVNADMIAKQWLNAFTGMMTLQLYLLEDDGWIRDNEVDDGQMFWGFISDMTSNWKLLLEQHDFTLGLNFKNGIEGGYRPVLIKLLRRWQKETNGFMSIYGSPEKDGVKVEYGMIKIFEDIDDDSDSDEDDDEE